MSVDYSQLLDGARQIEQAADKLDDLHLRQAAPYSPYGTNPTYPSYPYSPSTPTPAQPTVHDYSGQVQAIFRPYASLPEPSAYDAVLNALDAALAQLNTGDPDLSKTGPQVPANEQLSKVTSAAGFLLTWEGHGATAFKTEVLDKLPYYCASQFQAIVALRRAVEGHKAFVGATRDSVTGIVNATITAFDHADDCDPDDIAMALTVLAAVAAVVTAIPTLGASTVISAAVIGSVASIGAAGQFGEKWEGSISGTTSSAILASMQDKVTLLYNDVTSVEQEMSSKLSSLAGHLAANQARFQPVRPQIADMSVEQLLSDAGVGRAD